MEEEGSGSDDPQRIKRIAAASYNYESDPRWSDYWSNILFPPHMAARSDVVDHFKRKFYQRFVDPDLVVEAMTSTGSSQSAGPSVRSTSAPATENARPRTTASTTGTTAPPRRTFNPLHLDKRTIHFSVNAWVLVVAVLGVLPLLSRTLLNKAYRLSLLGTTLSSFYSLYSRYGKPTAWNLPSVQAWFQSIIATKDFIRLIYCLLFVSSQMHFKFALIPVLCWALEHVAKFLRLNFSRSLFYRKYLEEPCVWVESNITTLSILSSNAEIALGFLLILSMFSWQRNILQTFMYWHVAAEAHVPCSCNCWLSPERMGQDQSKCLSLRPPVCPVLEHSPISSPEMVVQVGERHQMRPISNYVFSFCHLRRIFL